MLIKLWDPAQLISQNIYAFGGIRASQRTMVLHILESRMLPRTHAWTVLVTDLQASQPPCSLWTPQKSPALVHHPEHICTVWDPEGQEFSQDLETAILSSMPYKECRGTNIQAARQEHEGKALEIRPQAASPCHSSNHRHASPIPCSVPGTDLAIVQLPSPSAQCWWFS